MRASNAKKVTMNDKNMMMDKKEVRKQIRELKRSYSLEDKRNMSVSVWEQVEADERFQAAKTVLAYWSMDDEVYTHDFVCKWAREKTMLLPCVRGEELDIRYFDGVENMCPGEGFAIPEPVGELFTDWEQIDVILVPGVAFDVVCNRLGRGKGYYDKILRQTEAYKLGVCFDFQFIASVPVEAHDVRMNRVIHS